jgi:hypothetical protein
MRRVFSITTIAALICSAASPLLAAACPHSTPVMACHRTKAQRSHCAMMHHEQAEEADALPNSGMAGVQSVESPASCPMECCTSGHPQGIAAAAAMTVSPSLVVLDHSMLRSSIVFTRSGFSSHTDRGPPIA